MIAIILIIIGVFTVKKVMIKDKAIILSSSNICFMFFSFFFSRGWIDLLSKIIHSIRKVRKKTNNNTVNSRKYIRN